MGQQEFAIFRIHNAVIFSAVRAVHISFYSDDLHSEDLSEPLSVFLIIAKMKNQVHIRQSVPYFFHFFGSSMGITDDKNFHNNEPPLVKAL